MKKSALYIFLLIALVLLTGCASADGGNDGGSKESGGSDGDGQTGAPESRGDSFVLKATVNSTEEADRISVEVIESDYAFGTYWVLVSGDTVYLDSEGKTIGAEDIKAGDTVEITYGGQVMMSYPPQIVATKIVRLK